MSQNMQPFVEQERKSVAWSALRVRLELLRLLQGRSLQRASARLFLTDYAREVIQKQFPFPDSNNAEIPHGIDQCFFSQRSNHVEVESIDNFNVIYVSTVNVYKHQIEVVQAIDKVAKRWPAVSLQLIGGVYDHAYNKRLQELIETVNQSHDRKVVDYIGKVPFSELPDIYQRGDLAVFASSCENLPNILLESMAASLPIVCSTYPPMPQVLKDGGEYCDIHNPDSIAASIEKFIASPELRKEKSNTAYTLAQDYSWQKTASLTFELLAQTARQRSVSSAAAAKSSGASQVPVC
jgi:glycosyltransferase involved in cell wall biosynthesis